MEPTRPSTDSSARRAVVLVVAAAVVVCMAAVYMYEYVRVGRNGLLRENIEWLRTVIEHLIPGGT